MKKKNSRLRAKNIFFRDFFGNFFFSGDYTPLQSPPGGLPPCSPPWGTTPPVGRFFFLKNNFFSSKTGTWVTFLVDWGQRTNIFRLFFGSDLWETPFWDPLLDPFLTPFWPVLDPFWTLWTYFGPFWTHFGSFWSLWVTIEAINRSQMASRYLKWVWKCQKSAQNGSKMAQNGPKGSKMAQKGLKWPKMG